MTCKIFTINIFIIVYYTYYIHMFLIQLSTSILSLMLNVKTYVKYNWFGLFYYPFMGF